MNAKNILTAGALAATLSMNVASANAQDQTEQQRTRQERQAQREQRLGRTLPANRVIGREVVARNGNKLGSVEDAIVDFETGRILFVVLDLGANGGNNKVAVPPTLLTVPPMRDENTVAQKQRPFSVEVGREALSGAPTIDPDQAESLASAAFLDKVYSHFNQPKWWAGAQGSSAGEFKNVHRASRIDKFAVQDVANAKLGKIETVLLDVPAARVVFALLDPANRISERQELIPIPPMALTKADKSLLTLDSTREKLNAAPKVERTELTRDDLRQLADPQFAKRVYDYYGKQPWFGNEKVLSPTGPDRPASQ